MAPRQQKLIAANKKARHDYFIVDEIEAGMVLLGTEVKALRNGQCNLKDSYARIKKDEVYVHQMHISPYTFAYYNNHEPLRVRKLLLHRSEIKRITRKMNEKGYSLIPLKVYFKDGKVKLLLGLAKGKKLYDKRETLKQRDAQRDLDRARKHDR